MLIINRRGLYSDNQLQSVLTELRIHKMCVCVCVCVCVRACVDIDQYCMYSRMCLHHLRANLQKCSVHNHHKSFNHVHTILHSDREEFLGPVFLDILFHYLQTSSREYAMKRRQTPAQLRQVCQSLPLQHNSVITYIHHGYC